MKKIMAVLTVLMCFASTSVFAQLKEVRGVQTRAVTYQGDDCYSCHGFEFKNENNYAVWVEAELCTNGFQLGSIYSDRYVNKGTVDTKSFTLNAGESYVWKCKDSMWYEGGSYHERFFVKYKAYKAE